MRKPLSLYHPVLYWLRVNQRRLFKKLAWYCSNRRYAHTLQPHNTLTHRYIKHTSKLIRHFAGVDLHLQHNKVTNLKIAVDCVNGIVIRPHEYFSFCKLVGKPTQQRGFVEGMELSFGKAQAGIGGGICQLSNLIHWMVLHSPLQVVERSHHSFDPFPDEGRVLPFGSGAAIFYNYVDLVIYNPTSTTFQIHLKVAEHQLEGELLADTPSAIKYHVYEKNSQFIQIQQQVFRKNEIWRDTISKGHQPQCLASTLLYKNQARVNYPVDASLLQPS